MGTRLSKVNISTSWGEHVYVYKTYSSQTHHLPIFFKAPEGLGTRVSKVYKCNFDNLIRESMQLQRWLLYRGVKKKKRKKKDDHYQSKCKYYYAGCG